MRSLSLTLVHPPEEGASPASWAPPRQEGSPGGVEIAKPGRRMSSAGNAWGARSLSPGLGEDKVFLFSGGQFGFALENL